MLEHLPTVKELIEMSGLKQKELCQKTGIDAKMMSEYSRGIWEPRFHNYSLIYDAVRKELTDGKK